MKKKKNTQQVKIREGAEMQNSKRHNMTKPVPSPLQQI